MTRSFHRSGRTWRGHKWLGRLISCLTWRNGSSPITCSRGSSSEVDLPAAYPAPELNCPCPVPASVTTNTCHKLSTPSATDSDNNVILLDIRRRTSYVSLVPEKAVKPLETYVDPFGELEMALYSEGLLEFRDSRASIPVLKIGYGFSDDELLALSKSSSACAKVEQHQEVPTMEGSKVWGDSSSMEPLIDGLPASVWLECVEPTLSILISLSSLRHRRSNLSIKKGTPEATGTNRCRHGDFEFGPIAIFRHPGHIQQMMLLRVEFLNAAANATPGNNPNSNSNQSAELNNRRGYNRHRRFRQAPIDEISLRTFNDLTTYLNESSRLIVNNDGNDNNSNNNNNKINNSRMNIMACTPLQNGKFFEDSTQFLYNYKTQKLSPSSMKCAKHNPASCLNRNCNAKPVPEITKLLLDRLEIASPPPFGNNNNVEDVDLRESYPKLKKSSEAAAAPNGGKESKTYRKPVKTHKLGSGQVSPKWKEKFQAVVAVFSLRPSVFRQGYRRQVSSHEDEDYNNCAKPDVASSNDNFRDVNASQDFSQLPLAESACPKPAVGTVTESSARVVGSLVIASAAVMLGSMMSAARPSAPSALLPSPTSPTNNTTMGTTQQPAPHATTTVPCPLSPATVATSSTTTTTTTIQPVDVLALGDNALWSLPPSDHIVFLPIRRAVIPPDGVDVSRPRSTKRHLLHYPRRLVRRARGAWSRWRTRIEHVKVSRDHPARL